MDHRALGNALGLISVNAWVPSHRMVPSAGAFATYSAASVPLAPGLFSTMIGWPSVLDMCSAIIRAEGSMAPPGTVPTMTRMIPLCASTDRIGSAASAARESASQTMLRRFIREDCPSKRDVAHKCLYGQQKIQ